MIEEIECFKQVREKDLVLILQNFFKDKFTINNDISDVYNISTVNLKIYD